MAQFPVGATVHGRPRADLNGAPSVGPYVSAIRGGPQGMHPTGPPYGIADAGEV